MELDFALLAEAADTSGDGKIHLLGGGFDAVVVPHLGYAAPPLAIVARFSGDINDTKAKHAIGFLLKRPDGVEKWIVEGESLEFAVPRFDWRRSQTTSIVRAVLKFEIAGKYEIQIYGDGALLKTLDLHVGLAGEV